MLFQQLFQHEKGCVTGQLVDEAISLGDGERALACRDKLMAAAKSLMETRSTCTQCTEIFDRWETGKHASGKEQATPDEKLFSASHPILSRAVLRAAAAVEARKLSLSVTDRNSPWTVYTQDERQPFHAEVPTFPPGKLSPTSVRNFFFFFFFSQYNSFIKLRRTSFIQL